VYITAYECALTENYQANDGGKKLKGAWDSIHVLEVHEHKKTAHYKLTSTCMLYLYTNKSGSGNVTLSGNMTRQVFELIAL
jgi:capping protein beta